VEGLFTVATMIVFGWWIYAAGRRLVEAGVHDLAFTPAARIWWFLVPLANLVMPFQGMRELYNASRGDQPYDQTPTLVVAWWTLYLANSIVAYVAVVVAGDAVLTAGLIRAGLNVAVGIAAILLVRRIAVGQSRLFAGNLAQVFA
jgi:hypothetical protein